MAFGFGFNKQKVLSAAEKFVQQGKLPSAIAEYEKILQADPKDLTVLNTVGDLYSRNGQNDKAVDCFKSVGDAYATQGFTVKAIAMYKKIGKLKSSVEGVLRLAELYTQQGLFNDARAQYLQVAEEFLHAGELEQAVRIFQKTLEMDPENIAMRTRLAEVYLRLNKKTEAWQIFASAVESLRARGSLPQAEEILQRMLSLDPGNSYALLLRGRNAFDNGDVKSAVQYLERVSDLDAHPEGQRVLLEAYLQTGRLPEAGKLAAKVAQSEDDPSALDTYADALVASSQFEDALHVYVEYFDRLQNWDSARLLGNLHSMIGHVRENTASLETLLDLLVRAGDNTHLTEIYELLAHAYTQADELEKARDFYLKLTELEPQNPVHAQEYRQVIARMGGAPAAQRLITPEEGTMLVDEIEATAPFIDQRYDDDLALEIRATLTDVELFLSYNMPGKALGPLLLALPSAPRDVRLNQRLAALHTRAGRFADAAACCRTLQDVYHDGGFPEEAVRYNDLATQYEERAAHSAPEEEEVASHGFPAEDLRIEGLQSDALTIEDSVEITPQQDAVVVADESLDDAVSAAMAALAPISPKAPAAKPAEPEHHIDLSEEWDDSVTVEAPSLAGPTQEVETFAVTPDPETMPAEYPAPHIVAPGKVSEEIAEIHPEPTEVAFALDSAAADPQAVEEAVEEVRFYLNHAMFDFAEAAISKLQQLNPDAALLAQMQQELSAAKSKPPKSETPEIVPEEESQPAEIASTEAVHQPSRAEMIPEMKFSAPPSVDSPFLATGNEAEVEATFKGTPEVEGHDAAVHRAPKHISADQFSAHETEAADEAQDHAAAHKTGAPERTAPVFDEFVHDLESSLGDDFPQAVASHQFPAEPKAWPLPPRHLQAPLEDPVEAGRTLAAESQSVEPNSAGLGQFVTDLEASLGDSFPAHSSDEAIPAPSETAERSEIAPMKIEPIRIPPPKFDEPRNLPSRNAPIAPPLISQPSAPPQFTFNSAAARSAALAASASAAGTAAALALSSHLDPGFDPGAGIDLADMFGELKQELEEDASASAEDPETHYNLGVAFREMGLLDEAIGELQKVCQAVEKGDPFPHIMQTYTWLAQCFLDIGVPEAAIRWYERALSLPSLDAETRAALHYELGAAYETTGNKPAALAHFTEVYGNNIDYRNVAERIKTLKS